MRPSIPDVSYEAASDEISIAGISAVIRHSTKSIDMNRFFIESTPYIHDLY